MKAWEQGIHVGCGLRLILDFLMFTEWWLYIGFQVWNMDWALPGLPKEQVSMVNWVWETQGPSPLLCVWFFSRSSPCQRISRSPEESSQSQHTPHPRWPHKSHILVSTFQEMPNELRGHFSLHNHCVMWSHLSFFLHGSKMRDYGPTHLSKLSS